MQDAGVISRCCNQSEGDKVNKKACTDVLRLVATIKRSQTTSKSVT